MKKLKVHWRFVRNKTGWKIELSVEDKDEPRAR